MTVLRRPAVFLDRDGVLVVPQFRDGRSFAPVTLEQFQLYDGTLDAVTALKRAGFAVIVVTNQPDVGAGRVAQNIVEDMNLRMSRVLPIDAIKVCWHRRDDGCTCRKPLPGMLIEAAVEHHIDLAASIMVGDRASDVTAGRAAGCRTVFIDLGYTAEDKPTDADAVVASLGEATRWILETMPDHKDAQ